jgi:uncharacterized protein YgiM (DUF1202 family)
MRRTLPASLLVAASISFSGAAFAGTLSTPKNLPITQGYLTIADMTMTVVTQNSHVRAKPTTKSKLLTTLPKGSKVTVIEKVDNGSWVHVRTGNIDGYMATKLLK